MRGKRSRKEVRMDNQLHYGELEHVHSGKAEQDFHRKPYQAAQLIKEQGTQLKPKTLVEYLSEKYDIKVEI